MILCVNEYIAPVAGALTRLFFLREREERTTAASNVAIFYPAVFALERIFY
jgi:hypothetical protein